MRNKILKLLVLVVLFAVWNGEAFYQYPHPTNKDSFHPWDNIDELPEEQFFNEICSLLRYINKNASKFGQEKDWLKLDFAKLNKLFQEDDIDAKQKIAQASAMIRHNIDGKRTGIPPLILYHRIMDYPKQANRNNSPQAAEIFKRRFELCSQCWQNPGQTSKL